MPEIESSRLLITGSRTWTHWPSIIYMIDSIAMEQAALDRELVVVHGKAKRGADALAAAFVRRRRAAGFRRIHEDPHPADWHAPCVPGRCRDGHRRVQADMPPGTPDHCPAAGRYRNELMVALLTPPGPGDQCVAFIRDESPGATGCAELAVAAGISTTPIRWEQRHRYMGEVG